MNFDASLAERKGIWQKNAAQETELSKTLPTAAIPVNIQAEQCPKLQKGRNNLFHAVQVVDKLADTLGMQRWSHSSRHCLKTRQMTIERNWVFKA